MEGDGKSTKKRLHQAQAENWAATKQPPWNQILQGLVLLGWTNGRFERDIKETLKKLFDMNLNQYNKHI